MDAPPKMTREEEFLKKEDFFRRNAFWIIDEMVNMSPAHPSQLVDEVLHSIFFLGEIKNEPKYSPQSIVDDENMLNTLKGRYPQPFKHFSSQLPKRTPSSCVLEMIVNLNGQKNENVIRNKLEEIIKKLKEGEATALVSSTICVSQKNTAEDSVRYYGVSMSTSGPTPGQIVLAASCLKNWDSYVADAVMTYYSKEKKKQKKSYFDGTIKLPQQVRCQAFSLSDGTPMAPCKSCGNMFGLTTSETKEWPYGNCAEAESLSNLLNNEKETREQVQQLETGDRQKAVENVEKLLKEFLNMQKFKCKNEFYAPQGN